MKEAKDRERMGIVGAALLAGATLCVGIAGGCGAGRPIKYYQLTVPSEQAPATDANTMAVTLVLGPILSSHLYREDRIVYSSAGGEGMGTYEYRRWAEPPTEMIQEVLLRELRASGKYRSVVRLRTSAHGEYLLRGHLDDFKEVSGNGEMARVAVEFDLRDTKSGATVWTHHYAHDEPVNGKEVGAVVAALDKNVQGIVGEVKAGLEQYFASHPATAAGQ